MPTKTEKQYDQQTLLCEQIFTSKNEDYGPSWRVLRYSSLIDQLYIKAKRIRTIDEKQKQLVADKIDGEFQGLINYCAMALIQHEIGPLTISENGGDDENFEVLKKLYQAKIVEARSLMLKKNHDYGEVWRDMWLSSLSDLILAKLWRIRKIIENNEKTTVSEGTESNLLDIINYAVFALIKLNETYESPN